jgi:putative ubiquitin-RnfH superfamily antitoxin RatB of RatAB toxin-antitoxin module
MAESSAIEVELAYSPRAGEVLRQTVTLPAGASVREAMARCPWALPAGVSVGVWGRRCGEGDRLRDRDRVEFYRALAVDPKEARRQRYANKRRA